MPLFYTLHIWNFKLKSAMKMNETFNVATLFHCKEMYDDEDLFDQNTLWRQTILGCKIVQLLQWVHGFNVNYIYQQQELKRDLTTEVKMYSQNTIVDFYVRPMSLRVDVLSLAMPVGAIFDWSFGFTLSYPDARFDIFFYSKPFTRQVWDFLYFMAIVCSVFFYLLKRWENKVQKNIRRECSYGYELLMVIGAYTQHIPPIEARILSRRTAYIVFFIFAYVVYAYYTSNLLSHLVNDTNGGMTLQELIHSDVECVVLNTVKPILNNNIRSIYHDDKISAIYQKVLKLRHVTIEEGLEAVKTTKTALLTDYVTIAPYIRKVFDSHEICTLAQIDVIQNLKKYFMVSKSFSFEYTEQFKVTILRLKEYGILSRLISRYYNDGAATIECTPPPHVEVQFMQILCPLGLLLGAYVLSFIILAVEKWHFNRYRIWPYVN